MKMQYALLLSMTIIRGTISNCPTIFGCQTCTDPNVCTLCLISLKFYLQGPTCVKNVTPNCREINSQGICINCNPRFFLVSRDKCDPVVPVANCLSYQGRNGRSVCISCRSTFSLTNGQCFSSITNCLALNPNKPAECAICISGHRWNGSSCAKSDVDLRNCVNFNLLGICSECDFNFWLNQALNRCLPVSVNECQVYTPNQNTCLQCNPTFYLDSSKNECIKQNDPNCDSFVRNQNKCQNCKVNYSVSTEGLCSLNQQNISNCQTLQSGLCVTCNDGFYLIDNQCLKQNVLNCSNYQLNTNTCVSCLSGFYLDENRVCQNQNIVNCQTHLGNVNRCFLCENGFYLSDGSCIKSNQPNCLRYKENLNECFVCNSGFYLDNNTCKTQSTGFCAEFVTNTNICRTCQKGYYLSGDVCLSQNVPFCGTYLNNTNFCTECIPTYYLADANDCRKQSDVNPVTPDPTCQYRDPDSKECWVCNVGFYLKDKLCLQQNVTGCQTYFNNVNQCLRCSTGYFLSQDTGDCQKQSIDNCEVYFSDSNLCQKCKFRHSLQQQTRCVPLTSCLKFESDSSENCLECALGFYSLGGICRVQTRLNCRQYNNNTNDCILCTTGAYLQNNDCLDQKIDNCQTYVVNKNECAQCRNTFYIDLQGQCLRQSVSNCAVYVPQTNRCQTCAANHTLTITFTCQAPGTPIPNCTTRSPSDSGCIVCNEGYYVRSDSAACLVQNIQFCKIHFRNSNQCRECESGYKVDNGGNCLNENSQIPNCYLQTGIKCLNCNLGFKPAGDELTCTPATSYYIGVNNSAGVIFLKFNPAISALSSGATLGERDINDEWFISRTTATQYNIISSPRTFALTGFSTSLVLITNTPGQLTQSWEITQLPNGNFNIKNSSSNLFITSASALGTRAAEITLVPI